jgi:hypothetical protein
MKLVSTYLQFVIAERGGAALQLWAWIWEVLASVSAGTLAILTEAFLRPRKMPEYYPH